MKPRELANVLIKLLGLLVCVYAIPYFVADVIGFLISLGTKTKPEDITSLATELINVGMQAVVGLFIIAKSRKVAGWMLKDGDE